MRRLFGGALATVGLALLLAAPAAAAEPSEMLFFERGRVAFAAGESCLSSADGRRETCTFTNLQVFKGKRGGTEPESRFRGEEVCVFQFSYTVNRQTGRLISESRQEGCARNRASLEVDFSTGLRWATVDGTMRLNRERCDQESCESDTSRVSIDIAWDAHGPVSDRFIYFRERRENCEYTFSGTEQARAANIGGHIGNESVRLLGELLKHDLQETRVCQ